MEDAHYVITVPTIDLAPNAAWPSWFKQFLNYLKYWHLNTVRVRLSTQNVNLVITVDADVLPPNGARQ